MKRTLQRLLAPVLAITLLLAGCDMGGQGDAGSGQADSSVEAGSATATAVTATTGDSGDWDPATATTVTLNGSEIEVSGSGATASGSAVTISQGGTYVLEGTLADGQVIVNAGKSDTVRLVLNGATLACSTSAPIYSMQASKTVVILAEGTENSVTDGSTYAYEEGVDEPDAAIFAKDDLEIAGSGSLTVTGQYNNGIGTKDDLTVSGGILQITARNDGIRGRDAVTVTGGELSITAENDGIKSNNDEDAAKGFITLSGGSYTIRAGHDGIQAETSLTISGGTYDIVTGGGADNAPVKQQEDFPGRGGGGQRPAAGETPTEAATTVQTSAGTAAGSDDTDATTTESDSKKGIKAGAALTVTGGAFTMDTEDDAVHSNGDVTISGGTFAIRTGDDGFHADSIMTVEAGDIQVTQCYEGIEGATVEIKGGDIFIEASDDAVNAAGGTDDSTAVGPMGQDRFTANENNHIRISGGTLEAIASGDTLDSNGNVYLEGGTLLLNGPSMGMEAAVDCDGDFIITGGTMVAVGSSVAPHADSTQASLRISHPSAIAAGTRVTLQDAQGNTVLEYTAKKDFSASAFTSPGLAQGETYALLLNGEKRGDITLAELSAAASEDGGANTGMTSGPGGGRGGFGGGRPGSQEGQSLPEGFAPPEGFSPGNGGTPPQLPEGQQLPDPPAGEDQASP